MEQRSVTAWTTASDGKEVRGNNVRNAGKTREGDVRLDIPHRSRRGG
jgi:hypothetical protein